jgi:cell wall-associated NlpC family hydrolase
MLTSKQEDLLMYGLMGVGAVAFIGIATADGSDPPEETPGKTVWRPGRTPAQGFTVPGSKLVNQVAAYIGSKWHMGRQGEISGGVRYFDCSGLLRRALNDLGMAPVAARQLSAGKLEEISRWISEYQAKSTEGALVVFKSNKTGLVRHVEISTGQGQTIGSQIRAGVQRFNWGWWNTPEQRKKWTVYYVWMPFVTAG